MILISAILTSFSKREFSRAFSPSFSSRQSSTLSRNSAACPLRCQIGLPS
nr:MAG TPA: hypothetical protein [Caudoviricetes sp.]